MRTFTRSISTAAKSRLLTPPWNSFRFNSFNFSGNTSFGQGANVGGTTTNNSGNFGAHSDFSTKNFSGSFGANSNVGNTANANGTNAKAAGGNFTDNSHTYTDNRTVHGNNYDGCTVNHVTQVMPRVVTGVGAFVAFYMLYFFISECWDSYANAYEENQVIQNQNDKLNNQLSGINKELSSLNSRAADNERKALRKALDDKIKTLEEERLARTQEHNKRMNQFPFYQNQFSMIIHDLLNKLGKKTISWNDISKKLDDLLNNSFWLPHELARLSKEEQQLSQLSYKERVGKFINTYLSALLLLAASISMIIFSSWPPAAFIRNSCMLLSAKIYGTNNNTSSPRPNRLSTLFSAFPSNPDISSQMVEPAPACQNLDFLCTPAPTKQI